MPGGAKAEVSHRGKGRLRLPVRAALVMVLPALALTGPCLPVERRKPPETAEESRPAPESPEERPESALLKPSELRRAVAGLMPACTHFSIRRGANREVVAGYRQGADDPSAFASLARVGNEKGSVVLATAMDGNCERITRVLTLAPAGELGALKNYAEAEERFLAQFAGRSELRSLREIEPVSGAEELSRSLAECIRDEVQALRRLRSDSVFVRALWAERRQIRASKVRKLPIPPVPPVPPDGPTPPTPKRPSPRPQPARPPLRVQTGPQSTPAPGHTALDSPLLPGILVSLTVLLAALLVVHRRRT